MCRDFELQKVCYLPLNTFLLRPLHRLMHYKQVLERLCKHHPPSHPDFRDCRGEPGAGAWRGGWAETWVPGARRHMGQAPFFLASGHMSSVNSWSFHNGSDEGH